MATKKQREKQVANLCQLFRGRLNDSIAQDLIKEHGGLQEAASFLMLSSTETIRQRLSQNAEYVRDLQRDAESFQQTLDSDTEREQFSCKSCDRMWWRTVPTRKQVSKCYRCGIKYDPIPKEHQWGWGEFRCPVGRTFAGFGIMGRTRSICRCCHQEAEMMFVIAPRLRDGNKKPPSDDHNCNGVNCPHAGCGYQRRNEKPPVCIHPHAFHIQEPVRIHWASKIHVSTGSTIVTILDQGTLDTQSRAPARSLLTILE